MPKSDTVEKQSIKLGTLIAALFYDLSPGKKIRVPFAFVTQKRPFFNPDRDLAFTFTGLVTTSR